MINAIAEWYLGQVISITDLRPDTLIKDDGIATLLREANSPTFVTINVSDFWFKIPPAKTYAIVGFILTQKQAPLIPNLLRNLLRLPEFRTKALRMGKIIRVRSSRIDYYERDRQVHTLSWPA